MPGYRLVHTTRYEFDEPIAAATLTAQLRPRDQPDQRVLLHQLIVRPGARQDAARDDFGNAVTHLGLDDSTVLIEIHAISELEFQPELRHAATGTTWEQVRDRLCAQRSEVTRWALPSGEIASAAVAQYARDYASSAFTGGRPLIAAAGALARQLREDIQSDAAAIHAAPDLATVFEARRGVCQDRARAAIACLRALGLAVRYVGGYLWDGKQTQAHAWFSVWLPDGSWIDLDPSVEDDPAYQRITVAFGLDADDVVPVRGTFSGGGRQRMQTSVRLAALADGSTRNAG